jgi:8-amino-7-oxononanoate synthase
MKQPSNPACNESKAPYFGASPENLGLQRLGHLINEKLETLAAADQYRKLVGPPKGVLDLSLNDYLGLAADDNFQNACRAQVGNLPVGSSSSRLVSGESAVLQDLEAAFSEFKNAESSLYFNSGYAANESVLPALASPECRIYSDSLNHASIIDGVRLSKLDKAQKHIYPHADYAALEQLLKGSSADYNILVTESLYSMDGDTADLRRLHELALRYRGVLLVDEAHSLGLYGTRGSGLISEYDIPHEHLISVNPCGKAMGTGGALVSGPTWFREYLINTARPLIFTTAASPWLVASLSVAIKFVAEMDAQRRWLRELSTHVHREISAMGYRTSPCASHIIPVIVGSNKQALRLSQMLFEKGIYAKAIRPPTVPENESRVRLSLNAGLSKSDVDTICSALRELKGEFV